MFTNPTLHGISLAHGGAADSLNTAVSDEELEVQAREGGPETKHGLKDDLGCG